MSEHSLSLDLAEQVLFEGTEGESEDQNALDGPSGFGSSGSGSGSSTVNPVTHGTNGFGGGIGGGINAKGGSGRERRNLSAAMSNLSMFASGEFKNDFKYEPIAMDVMQPTSPTQGSFSRRSWSQQNLQMLSKGQMNLLGVFGSEPNVPEASLKPTNIFTSPFTGSVSLLAFPPKSQSIGQSAWNNSGFQTSMLESVYEDDRNRGSSLHASLSMPSKLNALGKPKATGQNPFVFPATQSSLTMASHSVLMPPNLVQGALNPSNMPTASAGQSTFASVIKPSASTASVLSQISNSSALPENTISGGDNRPIRRIVSMPSIVQVRCTNVALGCSWKGPSDRLSSHVGTECLHQFVLCRYSKVGCGVRALRIEMSMHEEQEMRNHLELCESKIDELTSYVNVLESRRKKADSNISAHVDSTIEFTDDDMIMLLSRILQEHGKASVGKLGSLLHSYTNNHSLSAMCKEKYGGLKKFLETHTNIFTIGQDHPFNPTVWLSNGMQSHFLSAEPSPFALQSSELSMRENN